MWQVALLPVVCLSVCVAARGDVRVLVNRVALRAVDEPSARDAQYLNTDVDYYYVRDEAADVWCVRRWTNCTLSLEYHFVEEALGGNGSIAESSASRAMSGAGVVGVRSTLRAAHAGARVLCRCASRRSTTTLTVTLLMRNSSDGILNLKMNGVPLRYQYSSNLYSNMYDVMYAYTRDERIRVECDTQLAGAGVVLKTYRRRLTWWHDGTTSNTTALVAPDEAGYLQHVARNRTATLRTVFIHFLPLYLWDDTPLIVNASNSLLELYQYHGEQLIYYYYQQGETLTLSCTTASGLVLKYNYTLVFGGTEESHNDSVIKQMILSSGDNNTTLCCCLLNEHRNATVRLIRVVFRLKNTVWTSLTIIGVTVGAAAGAATLATALAVALRRPARRCAAPEPLPLEMVDASALSCVQGRPLPSAPCDPTRASTYDYAGGNDYYVMPAVRPPLPLPKDTEKTPCLSADDGPIYQNKAECAIKCNK